MIKPYKEKPPSNPTSIPPQLENNESTFKVSFFFRDFTS